MNKAVKTLKNDIKINSVTIFFRSIIAFNILIKADEDS